MAREMTTRTSAMYTSSYSPATSSSSGSSSGVENTTVYDYEEDHRRLLFGLMRSGLTPQVELALQLLDDAAHADGEDDGSVSEEDGEDGDFDSESSGDEYEYHHHHQHHHHHHHERSTGEEEGSGEEFEGSGEGETPTLTTKPLYRAAQKLSLNDPSHSSLSSPTTNRGLAHKDGENRSPDTVGGHHHHHHHHHAHHAQQPKSTMLRAGLGVDDYGYGRHAHGQVKRWLADVDRSHVLV